MAIKPVIIFLILLCLIGVLWHIIGYWRRKAGEAAYAAARMADNAGERDVIAVWQSWPVIGTPAVCSVSRIPTCSRTTFRSRRSSRGASEWLFTGIITRPGTTSCSAKNKGFLPFTLPVQEWRSARHRVLQGVHVRLTDGREALPYHVHAVQQLDKIRAAVQTARLVYRQAPPELTSGLYDVDVFDERESLHEAKGGEERILERNYRITRDIRGKEVIIVDDVLTTGQSVADYKEEIERCGGKVVAAIFYGKTVTVPPLFLVRLNVWSDFYAETINRKRKS